MSKAALSWFKPRKQWKKRRKGKTYYLGRSGVNKSDPQAYADAVAEWTAILETLEREERATELDLAMDSNECRRLVRKVAALRSRAEQIGINPDLLNLDHLYAEAVRQGCEEAFKQSVRLRFGELVSTTGTIRATADLFLDMFDRQVVTQSRSAGRRESLRVSLKHICEWVWQGRPAGEHSIAAVTSQFLTGYHGALIEQIKAGTLAPPTAQTQLTNVKQFIRWCHSEDIIDAPRNLGSRMLRIPVGTQAVRPATAADMQLLLREAGSDRIKLFLLLAMNCGMTQVDIAKLTPDEVDWDAGRIVRPRSKTRSRTRGSRRNGVPTVNYKLWPETLRLLSQYGSRSGAEVLLNERGKPLVSETRRGDGSLNRNDTISRAFSRLYSKCSERLSDRLTFKHLRSGAATLLHGDPRYATVTELYLGHAPRTIADRHYVAPPQALLDEAVVWLGEQVLPRIPQGA